MAKLGKQDQALDALLKRLRKLERSDDACYEPELRAVVQDLITIVRALVTEIADD